MILARDSGRSVIDRCIEGCMARRVPGTLIS
jgi:hypothetical protein